MIKWGYMRGACKEVDTKRLCGGETELAVVTECVGHGGDRRA